MIKSNKEMEINYNFCRARYNYIILDLDASLIHACRERNPDASYISFSTTSSDYICEYWVHKRPGFDLFLETCFKYANVGVWSTGTKEYVDAVVSLFPETPELIYSRNDCDMDNGVRVKILDKIPYKGKIVMIDDRSDVLKKTDRIDTIVIPPWDYAQKDDRILYHLLPLLFDDINIIHSDDSDSEVPTVPWNLINNNIDDFGITTDDEIGESDTETDDDPDNDEAEKHRDTID